LRGLEEKLAGIDHRIISDGLSKIETGKRRVDVDDLVALAWALEVSPLSLLFPPAHSRGTVELTPNVSVSAAAVWDWAGKALCGHCGGNPPDGYTCNLCGRGLEAS
jgi:hypothetical protein